MIKTVKSGSLRAVQFARESTASFNFMLAVVVMIVARCPTAPHSKIRCGNKRTDSRSWMTVDGHS
jgi:hypothetical protein